jgi:hypothetical protein
MKKIIIKFENEYFMFRNSSNKNIEIIWYLTVHFGILLHEWEGNIFWRWLRPLSPRGNKQCQDVIDWMHTSVACSQERMSQCLRKFYVDLGFNISSPLDEQGHDCCVVFPCCKVKPCLLTWFVTKNHSRDDDRISRKVTHPLFTWYIYISAIQKLIEFRTHIFRISHNFVWQSLRIKLEELNSQNCKIEKSK